MSGTEPRLGRLVAKPAKFQANLHIINPPYSYAIDERQGICKRTPLAADTIESSTFFEVVSEAELEPVVLPITKKPRRQLSRSTYSKLRTVFIGTIFAAIVGLLYPLYPGIKYDIQSQLVALERSSQAGAVGQQLITPSPNVSRVNELIIPKIGVDTKILDGSSLKILNHQEGVWHQMGDLQTGNFVVAGHRWQYLPPNSSTFYNLDKLDVGDVIIVDWQGKRYNYIIKAHQVVPKTDIEVLNQAGGPRITLYTCDDKRQTRRVVVTAQLEP